MHKDNVCVVMSSFNGSRYIKEQIESILAQQDVNVQLYIRDDGSCDDTLNIINAFRSDSIIAEKGENVGAKDSFLYALAAAPEADFYAFSDQDDFWEKNKLSVAINAIKKTEDSKPCLYCGSVSLVDADLHPMSEKKKKGFIYKNKLPFLHGALPNTAGCTMVFNKKLRDLIVRHHPKSFIMHDIWVKLVCLAVGGIIINDSFPYIKYRQHLNNAIGGKRNLINSVLRRLKFNIKKKKNCRRDMYAEILSEYGSLMPESNYKNCQIVCNYSNSLKDKIALWRFKDFWKGRKSKMFEKLFLVLIGRY